MKRDPELIRKILLHIEAHDNLQFDFAGYDDQTIGYHVRLISQAGLAHANAPTAMSGEIILQDSGHTALTWEGHEFLDAARDEARWKKAKSIVKEQAGAVSIGVLTQLLAQLMRQAIGL